MTRIISSLSGIALFVAVVAIIGATALPPKVEASGGGHINQKTRRIGPVFIYSAFDQNGHPVRNCKKMDYLPHYNINFKLDPHDLDKYALARFHITLPDQNKRVIVYESVTGMCIEISERNLKNKIRGILDLALDGWFKATSLVAQQGPALAQAAMVYVMAQAIAVLVIVPFVPPPP